MNDRQLVKILKALADPTRFALVQAMDRAPKGELSCGQLTELFDLAQPTISHHLKILGDAGLVHVRTDGQHHFFSIDRVALDEVLALLPVRLNTQPKQRSHP
jgi:ArsR family transcriptional regulator